ncbi:MAG: hypothetical protein HYV28_04270 [Ignavibacteriales bacterium]|nr:hypothetical protein [Ignavibacteriales bacterium]
MVIHLDKDHAICIEAKYQSGQSSYPSSDAEKVIFQNRKIKSIGQLPLQKYMLQELLGIDSEFVIISAKKEKSDTHKNISWTEVFSCLDLSGLPLYSTEMIKRITI